MIKIVHRLRLASGSNRKMVILLAEKNNDEWKKLLVAMYDNSINYYVSSPSDNTFVSGEADMQQLHYMLGELSNRTYTGRAGRSVALEGSQQFGELFRLVLGRSLKAGVSITTINKAYPGLIPTFEVMLAKDVPILSYPVIVSTKYDGVRLTVFVADPIIPGEPNITRLILRSGKEVDIKSLDCGMSRMSPGVYDGELVSGDGLQEGRTRITGQVNSCLNGKSTDIEDYTFCIFDKISHAEWDKQVCTTPYILRIKELNNMVQTPQIRVADMYAMQNAEQVNEFYADKLDKGYEGLIARYGEDMYEWKRTNRLIKKKATFKTVLECYDTTEGKNKYEGLIGALKLRGTIGGKRIHVKTGSGLSDHDRELPPEYYIGKEIEMLYNDIVRAKGADHFSLFIPRFKRVKGDYNV